jgi:hypothetical protein
MGEQTIARAFKAVLDSEPGHSRHEIGAQAAACAGQKKSLAQLAIGPTQKALPCLQIKTEAREGPQQGLEHGLL